MRLIIINILLLIAFSVNAQFANRSFFDHEDGTPPAGDIADYHFFFNNDALDASGNGHNGIVTDMVYGTDSPAEGSHFADFSLASRKFEIPSSYTLTSPFSISLWYRQSATGGFYEFYDPNFTNSNWEYWFVWARGDNHSFEFRGHQNGTGTLDIANTNTSVWVSEYVWHHLVFTYNNGIVAFFLDGVALTMSNNTTWGTADMKLNTTLLIGEGFSGHIDDVSSYSAELSQAKITELYNGGVAGTVLTSF